MPDISDYYTGGGSTLKAADIDDEITVTVAGWRVHKFDDGNSVYFLKLKDNDKEFRVNRTNAKIIAKMYGSDIDDWVGKTMRLMPDTIDSGKYQGTETITVLFEKPRKKPVEKQYDERNPPPPMDDEVPFMREDRA